MIPTWWVALVLGLGAYRVCRLLGWDDFPPIARARGWVTGEHVVTNGSTNTRMGLTSEPVVASYRYRRPYLAALLHCAFCLGFWVSLATYVAWRLWPVGSVTVMAPFALSAFVGLVARNWDP